MSVHVTTQATVVAETGDLDLARIIYRDPDRASTISASSEQTNFPADAAGRPDTYEAWKPSSVQAWWQEDMGSDVSLNSCGIAGHDLGTQNCRVWVEVSEGSPTQWVRASDNAEPTDDSASMLLFPARTARYWRLMVDGTGSPTAAPAAMPTIPVILFGSVLAMERRIYGGHTPVKLSRDTTLLSSFSRGGQFLTQAFRRRGYSTSASFRFLTPTWYRANFEPFVKSARRFPYFFAWRPGDWTGDVVYAWTLDDIRPTNMGLREFMQVAWEMKATGDE